MSNILCIDIGGTRIKAAILKNDIDINFLKNTTVEIIPSLGWLNSSLPNIISNNHPASLIQQCTSLTGYDYISISVPVNVVNNGTEIIDNRVGRRGLPQDLKKAFEAQSNCEVFIMNDSICWLSGALNYCRLNEVKIEFPCLLIALGTGVGLGYSSHMYHSENLELSNHYRRFPQLSQASVQLIDRGWKVHGCLGEKYFYSLKNEHKDWTYLDIQDDFTKRITALLQDIKDKNLINFMDLKTIFIGGGNASYVNSDILSNNLQKNICMLTLSNLQINPDLIPLLGQINIF
jgi:hypothetical protein